MFSWAVVSPAFSRPGLVLGIGIDDSLIPVVKQ